MTAYVHRKSCVDVCVLVEGHPQILIWEALKPPKNLRLETTTILKEKTVKSQASDGCLFVAGSAFNKPQAVSADFHFGCCLDRLNEEPCQNYFLSVTGIRSL